MPQVQPAVCLCSIVCPSDLDSAEQPVNYVSWVDQSTIAVESVVGVSFLFVLERFGFNLVGVRSCRQDRSSRSRQLRIQVSRRQTPTAPRRNLPVGVFLCSQIPSPFNPSSSLPKSATKCSSFTTKAARSRSSTARPRHVRQWLCVRCHLELFLCVRV